MPSLATSYLGLSLAHPIVPGASPIADYMDRVLLLEDAGASAVVMRSIFEEQAALEQLKAYHPVDPSTDDEPMTVRAGSDVFALGLDTYADQIRRIRERTKLGVIGSLNGTTRGGWLDYAARLEEAGAHALELNLYAVVTDPGRDSADVEREQLAVVADLQRAVRIPLAAKLSPYYSALPQFVRALEAAGAKAAVLFNRFYQSDIDPVRLQAVRELRPSTPDELLLRLRWLAILSTQTRLPLAASGGVHGPLDVVKALMAGAQAVQVVSSLLQYGPKHVTVLVDGLRRFLDEHGYDSVDAVRGCMNLERAPDPTAYQRSDYIQLLRTWRGRFGV
jgi:dihydroorotate dehydrogenase (fumarate)